MMDVHEERKQRRAYEPPAVSRVVIDLIQEMLQACSTTQGGKQDTSGNPPICTRLGVS
jgi:hypothetical protein